MNIDIENAVFLGYVIANDNEEFVFNILDSNIGWAKSIALSKRFSSLKKAKKYQKFIGYKTYIFELYDLDDKLVLGTEQENNLPNWFES